MPSLAVRLVKSPGSFCPANFFALSGTVFVSDMTAADGPVHTPTLRITPDDLFCRLGSKIPHGRYRTARSEDNVSVIGFGHQRITNTSAEFVVRTIPSRVQSPAKGL